MGKCLNNDDDDDDAEIPDEELVNLLVKCLGWSLFMSATYTHQPDDDDDDDYDDNDDDDDKIR